MKICIIIPAYNEEKRIARTLDNYCGFFSELKKKEKLDFEILIVINNTTDRTEEIVKSHMKKCKELKYLNFRQGGKGFAVIEGFKYALERDFDIIGFTDADMATEPREFYRLLNNLGNSDGVIGSRYLKNSIVAPRQTFSRILVSRIFNFLIRILFLMPYRDTQCGAKIFRKEVVENVVSKLSLSQWAFDVDLLYNIRKEGFKITELSTKWSDKEYSKINFMGVGPWMALALIRLRLLNSPFKEFVRFYNKISRFI